MNSPKQFDALVLGAGAAGCFAAIHAAQGGKKVLLVDHGKRLGGKIPISGGGRCNFTNLGADWTHFQGENPRFAASALSRYTPQDFVELVERHKIAWHEKHLGQLFCDGKAIQIVELLEKECSKADVETWLGKEIKSVKKTMAGFEGEIDDKAVFAESLVVALGGLSYPNLGASNLGLWLATQFGHRVVETAPALDGFVFGPKEKEAYSGLQGLALDKAELKVGKKNFADSVLFTHRGLSGPAGLQASLYWRPGDAVTVNLWPAEDLADRLLAAKKTKGSLGEVLADRWPKRLADRWIKLAGLDGKPLNSVADAALRDFAASIQAWTFKPATTVGYHRAEVTRGGVDTAELNQKTMESRKVPGLYFVGEVVDITGELGGYNFQWAWASGWAAGMAIGES